VDSFIESSLLTRRGRRRGTLSNIYFNIEPENGSFLSSSVPVSFPKGKPQNYSFNVRNTVMPSVRRIGGTVFRVFCV